MKKSAQSQNWKMTKKSQVCPIPRPKCQSSDLWQRQGLFRELGSLTFLPLSYQLPKAGRRPVSFTLPTLQHLDSHEQGYLLMNEWFIFSLFKVWPVGWTYCWHQGDSYSSSEITGSPETPNPSCQAISVAFSRSRDSNSRGFVKI